MQRRASPSSRVLKRKEGRVCILTVREAAELAKMDERSIRIHCEMGSFPCRNVSTGTKNKTWRIPRDTFIEWLKGENW